MNDYTYVDKTGMGRNSPVSQQFFPSGEQPEYSKLAHEL